MLARTPGAPEGTRGISLFLVPKILPDGSLNDLRCVSIEHKLGIHASPTCVMSYGDHDGAIGWLVGPEMGGMAAMFTMMNNARLNVGLQGVGIAEAATQRAVAYALERKQGQRNRLPVAIAEHPDVRRMLLRMRALTMGARALCYYAFGQVDRAARGDQGAGYRAEVLTPLAKAWCTDVGIEVANLGVQVHGGMGYIEETGAAQFLRDARITPIYEGTNGIQANDLAFRKVARDGGVAARQLFEEMARTQAELAAHPGAAPIRDRLVESLAALMAATDWVVETATENPAAVAASAVHYLRMFGLVAGGWLMARAALAEDDDARSARPSWPMPASSPTSSCPRPPRCCCRSPRAGGAWSMGRHRWDGCSFRPPHNCHARV